MKITKKQLKQLIKEELVAMQRLDETIGQLLSSDDAMREIAKLVKSTAARTVPDQAIETVGIIVRGWEQAQQGGGGTGKKAAMAKSDHGREDTESGEWGDDPFALPPYYNR